MIAARLDLNATFPDPKSIPLDLNSISHDSNSIPPDLNSTFPNAIATPLDFTLTSPDSNSDPLDFTLESLDFELTSPSDAKIWRGDARAVARRNAMAGVFFGRGGKIVAKRAVGLTRTIGVPTY